MSLEDYPVDDDYIGVEEQAAEIPQTEGEFKLDIAHTYDRSDTAMSGTARDVEIDRRTVTDRDDRGGTRTGFNPSEATESNLSKMVIRDGKKRSKAQWLLLLQQGYRDISMSRAQQNADAETQSYIETFTSAVEMNSYQRDRTEAIVESINMAHMAHYPREVIILATISIVANEDDRWIRDESGFKGLVSDLDASLEDIKNARMLVKGKSSLL